MKMTDGLFHRVFDEIAAEYPNIENEHWIIDIGAAKLADTPEEFDVIVMPNLYGDILSDIAAQIAGSVGLGGSANIGEHVAMFEAIHGSAPLIANQNKANPSGLLHGAIMMLVHINQTEAAERVHNAWVKTIEDGVHTYDIFKEGISKQAVGTKEFAEAVFERLGQKPETLKAAAYAPNDEIAANSADAKPIAEIAPPKKETVGVDVFLDWRNGSPDDLGEKVKQANGDSLELQMITNRGVKVFPNGMSETFCTDHWRCRFVSTEKGATVVLTSKNCVPSDLPRSKSFLSLKDSSSEIKDAVTSMSPFLYHSTGLSLSRETLSGEGKTIRSSLVFESSQNCLLRSSTI
jgi:isocitrate dehydrogenase